MRISELAAASGVPIATIKFYLRERLIPPGTATASTRAVYDERHLRALALAKALLEARLSVASARQVVAWLDTDLDGSDVDASVLDVLSEVHELAIARPAGSEEITEETRERIARYGWSVEASPGAARELQDAIATSDASGFELIPQVQDVYARAMNEIAEIETAHAPQTSLTQALRYCILGGVLMERVLLSMRRLAEATSIHRAMSERPGTPGSPTLPPGPAGMSAPEEAQAQASDTSSV